MPSSPTVWRRWLAHQLLTLRKEAGLERAEVAKAIRCTTQKIGHLETATVPPKISDLEEIMLPMYGVPEERWSYYLQAARDARKKGWWESYSDTMPSWFSLYVGLEQGASELYHWNPQVFHGLLQTRDYMTAVIRGGSPELPDIEVEHRVEVRMARQQVLDDDSYRLWVVLGEAALRAGIDESETMRIQLEHVLDLAQRPRITVQVLPTSVGVHPGLHGPFTLMGFQTSGDPGVVYVENRTGAVYLEEAAEIKAHQVAFEHLCSLALSPVEAQRKIAEIAEETKWPAPDGKMPT